MAELPARGEGTRNMGVQELIEKARAEQLPLVSAATVRNKLRAVSAVLTFGVRMGVLKENPILASGLSTAVAKAATALRVRRRKSYTREEVEKIFRSPAFTSDDWAPPRANFGRAWYWMPLLMYYTGARRGELAQLTVADVRLAPGTLVHFLSILSVDDEGDAGRRVKNEGSRRQILLHADLLARGFLEYVDGLPKPGPLFPLLTPSAAGFRGENFGKQWRKYLMDVVKLGSPAHPSHGFRHTFKTFCREVGIPEDVSDAITGHVGGQSEGRKYGEFPLARMHAEMEKYPLAVVAMTTYLAIVQKTPSSGLLLEAGKRTIWGRLETLQNQMPRRICNASQSMCRANARDLRASNILEDAKVTRHFNPGDSVRLVSLPDWLWYDLPKDEQTELLALVGSIMKVQMIDAHGYVWLGSGTTTSHSDHSTYSGHSFGVPPECLELGQ